MKKEITIIVVIPVGIKTASLAGRERYAGG
jgi:hypothetical protein